ncbi:PEP-CTERM sorting domain-containing protein [Candidatus Spyradosoma sp. SGI.093]|uniref:PEP-CTERM sorting domain-containing protein n=1 Tax=Candidatus Spyradosoma sp. SGI.093 TaxID=3420583 RepID=UPI003CFE8FB8
MKERLSLAAVVFAAFACGSFVARAEIVFAKGVTLESGWYDVNKAYWPATLNITVDGEGTHYTYEPKVVNAETLYPNSDYDLCWAATASNMLQWWQDRIGPECVPAGTPDGKWDAAPYADRGQLEIYKTFCENWTDAPGVIETGLAWWLDGSYFYKNYETELVAAGASFVKEGAVSTGGYFAGTLSSARAVVRVWDFPGEATTADVAERLTYLFENDCMIGLAISNGGNVGHALTCWGVETDEAGGVTLYYTDSDDCTTNLEGVAASEGGGEELKSMSVTVTDGVVSFDYLDSAWRLETFTTILAVVPEPSAFGLFAGAGALVFSALRRRRRRAVRSS